MGRDENLDKELRFHIDERIDDLVASGVAPEEARRRARLEFGGVMQTKEAVRDLHLSSLVDGLLQDLRLAVRTLRTTPVVTAVAILSLALGIGANTAIFSLVNGLLLRPLPVAAAQQLVSLSSGTGTHADAWTYPLWTQIQKHTQPFDGALAWAPARFNLARGGEVQTADGLFVSGDYFATLGVPAILGRTFTAADDVRGGGPDGAIAVISYAFWQRTFGGQADAVGRTLSIERVPFTVIGITPPEFFGAEVGRAFDVAVPLGVEPLIRGRNSGLDRTSNYFLKVMLRLKPGQSIESAAAPLRAAQPQIREAAMPRDYMADVQNQFMNDPIELLPAVNGGSSDLRRRFERPLTAMLIVVALVLLIACANIANLLLARTTARRPEMSLRLALGASRWRLARQLVVESLVLSAAGAGLGLLFAAWASGALLSQLSTQTTRVAIDVPLDWRVLSFTIAVSVITTMVFGIAPAWRASDARPNEALAGFGRGTADHSRIGFAGALVVAQVALSLILVVAAGLFVRTFEHLANKPLGFDTGRVLTMTVNALRARVDPAERIAFFYRLTEAAAGVPGVAHAAASIATPLGGNAWANLVDVQGATPRSERERTVTINAVTPQWLATYGIPLRAGRDFDERDTRAASAVVMVNEEFVRRFFPDGRAIGHTLTLAPSRPEDSVIPKAIVGVTANAVYRSLRDPLGPTIYLPLSQLDSTVPPAGINISLQSASSSPAMLARSITAAFATVDPDLSFSFRLLQDQIDASLIQERLVATLSGFFGTLALFLAGLGLYGVTSYAVSRRRAEIGIRMALGAAPGGVIRLVLSRVTLLVAIGVIIGTGISLWATRFVGALLYGLEPRDPLTLAGSAVILATVGAIAGWLPAYRASRIDPAVVLRNS